MKLLPLLPLSLLLSAPAAFSADVVISGFLPNPAGTDSPYEYVQLVATRPIDFSVTNYAVVFSNNGTATSAGWAAGGGVTYGFSLTSGSVAAGQVFYVGGNGKTIDGSGSTDISSQTWIRTINSASQAGDAIGASGTDILGNGGANADGISIFNTSASAITASSIPQDAVFFGSSVGTDKPATGGYVVPDNDLYNGGVFGGTGSTALMADPGGSQFVKLTGTYNTSIGDWSASRTSSLITLTATAPVSTIASGINLVPEPGALSLAGLSLGALLLGRRKRAALSLA